MPSTFCWAVDHGSSARRSSMDNSTRAVRTFCCCTGSPSSLSARCACSTRAFCCCAVATDVSPGSVVQVRHHIMHGRVHVPDLDPLPDRRTDRAELLERRIPQAAEVAGVDLRVPAEQ